MQKFDVFSRWAEVQTEIPAVSFHNLLVKYYKNLCCYLGYLDETHYTLVIMKFQEKIPFRLTLCTFDVLPKPC